MNVLFESKIKATVVKQILIKKNRFLCIKSGNIYKLNLETKLYSVLIYLKPFAGIQYKRLLVMPKTDMLFTVFLSLHNKFA